MKHPRFMKTAILSLLVMAILTAICGCGKADKPSVQADPNAAFFENEDGNLVTASGEEYAHFANEGILYYLGELVHEGTVSGEEETDAFTLMYYIPYGVYSIEGAETDHILVRHFPDSEWLGIYRKASLPPFDISVDNCIRLELVMGNGDSWDDAPHATCGDGLTDPEEIAAFLADVRTQKDPHAAGFYDLVKKPDGMLENCYVYAVIYGFFAEEPNVAIRMRVLSFNDLAYSVEIGNEEYVLPEAWLQRLLENEHR